MTIKLPGHSQPYVNSYDIVGFAEILNDTARNLPNFSPPLIIKATKRKRRGRPSGGHSFI
jgi:hypothetical protein